MFGRRCPRNNGRTERSLLASLLRLGVARALIAGVSASLLLLREESVAVAAGFASARFGGEHGNPTESNPTALYFNPAGIAHSEGIHLFVDGSLALRHVTWTHQRSANDVAEPPGAELANYGKASLTNVFGGPALAATARVGDVAFGLGLFVPFAGRASWDKNEAFAGSRFPLAVDGVQRWHGIEGSLTSLYLTGGAAYKFGPLSVGLSGNLIFSSLANRQAKNLVNGNNDINQEARSEIDVSGRHASFGAGVMWEAIDRTLWIGASYQASPGITDMMMQGTLTSRSSGTSAETRTDQVDFHQSLPDIFRAGVRYRIGGAGGSVEQGTAPRVELRLFGDYTRWSKLEQQCVALRDRPCGINRDGTAAPGTGTVVNVYRGWQDTFGVRAGGSYWFAPHVEAFVGVGFDRNATPDNTLDPALPDATSIAPALGGRFEIWNKLYLSASYTHIQYLDRNNIGKSVLDDPAVAPTTRRVSGDGEYTAWIGVLNINAEKQF